MPGIRGMSINRMDKDPCPLGTHILVKVVSQRGRLSWQCYSAGKTAPSAPWENLTSFRF